MRHVAAAAARDVVVGNCTASQMPTLLLSSSLAAVQFYPRNPAFKRYNTKQACT